MHFSKKSASWLADGRRSGFLDQHFIRVSWIAPSQLGSTRKCSPLYSSHFQVRAPNHCFVFVTTRMITCSFVIPAQGSLQSLRISHKVTPSIQMSDFDEYMRPIIDLTSWILTSIKNIYSQMDLEISTADRDLNTVWEKCKFLVKFKNLHFNFLEKFSTAKADWDLNHRLENLKQNFDGTPYSSIWWARWRFVFAAASRSRLRPFDLAQNSGQTLWLVWDGTQWYAHWAAHPRGSSGRPGRGARCHTDAEWPPPGSTGAWIWASQYTPP